MTPRPPDAAAVTPPAQRAPAFDQPRKTPTDRPVGLSWWVWGVVVVLATAAAVAGLVLRFVARSPLWLDEAQSVAIARLPLHHGFTLFDGLRQDGAPPLYYLLLHQWLAWFGDSNVAVRSLSGMFSVLTLPLAWLAGRWVGGRRVGVVTFLLLATSPFAIRYATETRMYSLVLFEVMLGTCLLLALHRWRHPALRAFLALGLAVDVAALFNTHYWGFYLVGVVGLGLLYRLARRRQWSAALWSLGAFAAGAVAVLPWLPTLVFQLHHTGTPWIRTATSSQVLSSFDFWAGDPAGAAGPLLLGFEWVLAFVAIVGHRDADGHFTLRRPLRPTPLRLALATVGTLLLAWLAAIATGSGWSPRYTVVALAPFVLLMACAVQYAGARVVVVVVALLCALGMAGGVQAAGKLRTQAGQIAQILHEVSLRGDVVGYCPDQLGPPVARLAPTWLQQYSYPGLRSPGRVDWVDYRKRIAADDPTSYVKALVDRAGPRHTVFLVYVPTGYAGFASKCERIANELTKLRKHALRLAGMNVHDEEFMRLVEFPPDTPSRTVLDRSLRRAVFPR